MNELTIKNLADFVRNTDCFDLKARHVICRGQGVKGNLLPNIARNNPNVDTVAEENEMFKQFKLIGASFLREYMNDATVHEWDALTLAQHFGMKTRLLDWTTNPLAALWFACSAKEEGHVFVYELYADNLMNEDVFKTSPFDQTSVRVIQPRFNNSRIIAQQGWFTVHSFSVDAGRFVSLEDNPEFNPYITEYTIPQDRRAEILLSLDSYGISQKTLFPDLMGLCSYLNWKSGRT